MKHFWFGQEWSMAYYLAYNCTGKPLMPKFVFEVHGDVDFVKGKTKINRVWHLHKPRHLQNQPLKEMCHITKPWKCNNSTAQFVFRKWFGKRTPIEFMI